MTEDLKIVLSYLHEMEQQADLNYKDACGWGDVAREEYHRGQRSALRDVADFIASYKKEKH